MTKFTSIAWIAGVFAASLSFSSRADELVLPAAQAEAQGYLSVPSVPPALWAFSAASTAASPLPEFSLDWPVLPEDSAHAMGNVMAQYQNYGGSPYFHGGCDLRTEARAWITAPVSGRLEAHHYAYTNRADGSLEKRIMPWPQRGQSLYFELAIVTDEGYRFEFHHVDRDTLPPELVQALHRGDARVQRGARIGRVHVWPEAGVDGALYHHVHYNIYAPDGTHLNPEHYSVLLTDHVAPLISNLFAVREDGSTVNVREGMRLDFSPGEFIVGATDMREDNVYVHTPSMAELALSDGRVTGWDFRAKLLTFDGRWPDIRDVFASQVRTPEGRVLVTRGDYQSNFFLMRLRVPSDAHGPARVRVGDTLGNVTEVNVSLP